MAEGLLKKYLKALGKNHIEVHSAGMIAFGGSSPTDRTIEVMMGEGVDVSGYRTKSITDTMIRDSDLILVMERAHKDAVLSKVPEAMSKTFLLKEFGVAGIDAAEGRDADVADPIGMPIEGYRDCLGTIEREINRIAALL